ncbi:MAG: His/Gly/Thr/Pro-type tRNA ligase C-terminal domain-containing protein, partial [Aristaeellaceae bacterium]
PIWPISIAPWHVHLCSMRADNPEVAAMSQKIHDELTALGVEVIWDDRPVSAGVMFADADLFGIPVRVIVSPKGLKNGTIEVSTRDKSMQERVPADEAVAFIHRLVVDKLSALDCHL